MIEIMSVCIFQMHLFLWILILTTIHALPDIDPHEGATFQQQGYLIGGLSWAHITAPINITRMEDDVNHFRAFTTAFDFLSKPRNALVEAPSGWRGQISDEERMRMRVLRNICDRRINRMMTVLKDLQADLGIDLAADVKPRKTTRIDADSELVPSADPVIREKRQVIIGLAAIGGMIVGAIAGSLFSQFKTAALVDILNQKVDTVVHQVDNLSIGLYQDQQDIKNINRTLGAFHELVGKLLEKDEVYDHYFQGVYSTLLLEDQASRFALAETAIDQLLLGKLHKGLISPNGLKTALDDLATKAQQRGLLVGVKRPIELYQLHTSFIYDQDSGILHAVIHVPLYRESHVLTLKRYVPIPFFSPKLERFIQISPTQTYLAQSPDNTLIKTLDEQDLSACLNIGHAYFCEDHALQKSTTTNCLLQLSKGIKQEDLGLCPIHILPQANSIHQISKDKYIIATSLQTSIVHSCHRSQSSTHKLNPGTYTITVDPNCTTSSDHWVIYPTIQIEDVNINTTTVNYDFDIPQLHDDMSTQDLQTIQNLLGSIGQPVPLSQMTQLLKFRKDIAAEDTAFQLAHVLFSGGSAFITVFMILGCIAGGYLFIRFCRHRRNIRRNRLHDDEHELAHMMMQAPPAPIIIQAPAPLPAQVPAPIQQAAAAAMPIDPVVHEAPPAAAAAPTPSASKYYM